MKGRRSATGRVLVSSSMSCLPSVKSSTVRNKTRLKKMPAPTRRTVLPLLKGS